MTAVFSTSGEISIVQEQTLLASKFLQNPSDDTLIIFRNKMPKFNGALKTYCLNFSGRVTLPSVKNFQLTKSEADPVSLQFGRVALDRFNIDCSHPIPILMGLAISLTTFDAIEKI
jgi:hypothetical protein